MPTTDYIEATPDTTRFDNAIIGDGALVEPDVMVGFRYHAKCGPARIGSHCILRKGTIIYGDVTIGDHFQSCHYAVIRAMVKMGDYCTLCNQSTIEGIVRMGNGVRIMSHTYIPSRTWIGDSVFIGPGVTFLNDRFPGRRDPMPTPRGATIHDDVMIGGGATILPGITIGETAVVGDGCSLLHGVTLGGTGKEVGDRHPKIGKGVLLSVGAKVLGNIQIGDEAKVAALMAEV